MQTVSLRNLRTTVRMAAAMGILLLVANRSLGIDATSGPSAQEILDTAGIQGGLVVHLGCGDGRLTARLMVNDAYLVHGLDTDRANVDAARAYLGSLELYGQMSVEQLGGTALPYNDNMVNLIVAERSYGISSGELDRVLCPGGVLMVRKDGKWTKTVKPWPEDIDPEWTHFLRDSTNNAVARDAQVGSPRHLQWWAGPKRMRDHDALASLSAMTADAGRLFYLLDEGPTSMTHHPPEWRLIARDAFNGTVLWKRTIDSWLTHLYYFRSGPVQLPRRLVSVGRRVYTTLGFDAPISALDAATGKTVRTYAGSANTEEIVYHDGILLALIGDPHVFDEEAPKIDVYAEFAVDGEPTVDKSIVAYRAETGERLWEMSGANLASLAPLSLIADGRTAYYLDNENLHAVDLHTGQARWRAPFPTEGLFLRSYAPTVVVHDDVVLCLSTKRLAAFDTTDGKRLWENKGYLGFTSPGDLFVIDGLAWTFPGVADVRLKRTEMIGNEGSEFWGIDLHTGEVVKTIKKADVWPGGHHHRCYRNKATERYLVSGRRGLEFVDLEGNDHAMNWWVRGICQYGVMPCNGLTYVPPDPCRCFNFVKFNGFKAMAASNSLDTLSINQHDRLHKGPAYDSAARPSTDRESPPTPRSATKTPDMLWHPPVSTGRADDWPTFRHDITRSGSTPSSVTGKLKKIWKSEIGGDLSSVVVADGRLLVASKNRHTVYCLDADSGRRQWQFIASGPVDSPPTLVDGLAVFGSRDGFVYALRASDGRLVWRFRGAPVDRRIVADGRLESLWPIHGSVLVLDGVAYFAVGRTSYLDGGIRLYGLDVYSGEKLYEASTGPDENQQIIGALPDVLVSNGNEINMRQMRFDRRLTPRQTERFDTLLSMTGLLEDSWMHRINTGLATRKPVAIDSPTGGDRFFKARDEGGPYGKLIVFDDQRAFAVQNAYTILKHTSSLWPSTHTGHLHQKYSRYVAGDFPVGVRMSAEANSLAATNASRCKWNKLLPVQIRAMVLADDRLLVAGWPDAVRILQPDGVDPGGKPGENAMLWTIEPSSGQRLAGYRLDAPPVFDGMAVARGRLYVSLAGGTIVCLAGG